MKNNLCRNNRHPTERKCLNSTYSLSFISCGKREQDLLRYIKKTNERLNIKACAKAIGIPRTSVYDILNTLQRKNLVVRSIADAKLTNEGQNYLSSIEGGVETLRRGCRDSQENLSTHNVSYKFEISQQDEHWTEKIKLLNYTEYKINRLPNLIQHIFYFDDATIIVTQHKVRIKIKEVVSDNFEENAFQSFTTAINYVDKLSTIGIKGSGMYLEEGHYARVNSIFAETLEKYLDKYSVTLTDGTKFWIDHSPPNDREDETNNAKLRERTDEFVKDLLDSESVFSDVDLLSKDMDKMKDIVSGLIKFEVMKFNMSKQKDDLVPLDRPTYLG